MLGLNKYLLGSLGFAVVTAGFLYWRLDAVATDRDNWRMSAEKNEALIEVLRNETQRNEAILAELRQTREAIQADSARTRRALRDLENSNEEVRAYLDQPIPVDVVGLLWPDQDRDDPVDAPK